MRKYTSKLLVGFKSLCDKPEARIKAKAREAIGIAIINEAGIGEENLRTTVASPWMGEVKASFNEMIDEGWVEQIPSPEDTRDYQEFENAILKFYGEFAPDLKERILKREYPFGDHWFRLTSEGEEAAVTLSEEKDKGKIGFK